MLEFIQSIDGQLLLWIQEYIRVPVLNPLVVAITSLGNAGLIWIALCMVFCLTKKYRRVGIAGLLSLLLCFLITNVVLKNAVARIRPYEVIDSLQILIAKPHDFSFPSGHTASSFAAAMALVFAGKKKEGIAAIILATAISFSRLYIGVHYPTDVICGALIGTMCAYIIYKIIPWWEEKIKAKGKIG
ncbi:MAG: phosphatase PAP2 family protein [Lachnospiraceae bacterium]|nr:phosphatase PAP2 family protein [Lachnospiraceae bacterium]